MKQTFTSHRRKRDITQPLHIYFLGATNLLTTNWSTGRSLLAIENHLFLLHWAKLKPKSSKQNNSTVITNLVHFPCLWINNSKWGTIFITYFSVPTYLPILLDRATFLSAAAGMLLWVSHTIANTAHWSRREPGQRCQGHFLFCFLERSASALKHCSAQCTAYYSPWYGHWVQVCGRFYWLYWFYLSLTGFVEGFIGYLKKSPMVSKQKPFSSKVTGRSGNKN